MLRVGRGGRLLWRGEQARSWISEHIRFLVHASGMGDCALRRGDFLCLSFFGRTEVERAEQGRISCAPVEIPASQETRKGDDMRTEQRIMGEKCRLCRTSEKKGKKEKGTWKFHNERGVSGAEGEETAICIHKTKESGNSRRQLLSGQ